MKVGDQYIHEFQFTQDQVQGFADVTGDNNPVHLAADYAATTMFKRPIVHGMLGASLFSKVFGTIFPGEGTIYLNQTLNFMKPMYVEEAYQAVFEVKEVNLEKHRAIISTTILNAEGKAAVTGEATLMNTAVIV